MAGRDSISVGFGCDFFVVVVVAVVVVVVIVVVSIVELHPALPPHWELIDQQFVLGCHTCLLVTIMRRVSHQLQLIFF